MTFFSGTDTATLKEEGSYKNNFVSLIVNNEGSYTAAITRHVFSEVKNDVTYTYEMFGDGTVTGSECGVDHKECIEYFMLRVNKPEQEPNPLDARIKEILAKKSKYTSPWYYPASTVRDTASYKGYQYNDVEVPSKADAPKKQSTGHQMEIPWEGFETPVNLGIDKKALNITMAKLLTGSVTCNPSDINIESWINNYDNVYKVKFNDLVEFSEWISPYMEFIMYHIPGTPTDVIDEPLIAAYANEIIRIIGKPKGAFSAELVDQLKFYGTV